MSLSKNSSTHYKRYSYILFLLLVVSVNGNAATWANTHDSLTLVQFQKEVIKLGWPTLWDTTQNVRQWYGIRLGPVSGKVESIIIHGDDFGDFTTDTLPSCIKTLHSLDSLNELYFSYLGLKAISPEIGGFNNLTTLGLQHNNLSTVPGELAQLTSLEYLFISSNKITDLPDLSALQEVACLSLLANWQLPEIPATVYSLSKLKQLDIGYTSVAYIPDDISNLTKLERLDADAANLDSISSAVGDLSNLTILQLSNNHLTYLPESLGQLSNLTSLDISRNQLTELPEGLDQLGNLRGIAFTNNLLDSFPDQLVNLPKLININGENNRMKGSLPAGLFAKTGLRLYLEGNELSGKLEIQGNNIPARLYIKENRFTIKDIIEHYNLFNPANNTYIEFQPQKNIGTARTYYPESNSDFTIEIDNYIPAEGCTFTWLRSPYSNGDNSEYVSSNQVLEFQNFNPLTDGGNYYCFVKHLNVPDLSLKSNIIRIIGTDRTPEIKFENVLFRPDSIGIITVYATDDYTPVDSLIYNFPEETEHFYLEPYHWPYKRKIIPKNNTWIGSDTLYFSVEDENGNIVNTSTTITLLSVENTAPFINIPDIYMSFYQNYLPSCEPGTEGCSQQYLWESWTFLKYFVKDDLTPLDDLEFSIMEVDASGQYIENDKINAYLYETMEGVHLDAYVFANYDTTFTLTLQATDNEGGVSQQSIRFIARVSVPNEDPVTDSVPTQTTYKGATQFPPLNLNDYVKDDCSPDSLLTWRGGGSLLLNIEINDSIASVSPKYVDSIFTTTYTYYVYEKTNEWRHSSVEVTYTVLELLKITGTIKDTAGLPLENVKLIGFTEPTFTDSLGKYEVEVHPGWSGKVFPVLQQYSFTPDTVEYSDVLSGISKQDYVATILPAEKYQIKFIITDGLIPLENAGLSINNTIYISDKNGIINIVDIESGKYKFTVSKNGFWDLQDSLSIEDNDIIKTIVLNRITSINSTEQSEIKCYPNPVREQLNVEIPQAKKLQFIQIYDINGKLVSKQYLGKSVLNIPFYDYEKGVYLVHLVYEDTIKIIKIIKR